MTSALSRAEVILRPDAHLSDVRSRSTSIYDSPSTAHLTGLQVPAILGVHVPLDHVATAVVARCKRIETAPFFGLNQPVLYFIPASGNALAAHDLEIVKLAFDTSAAPVRCDADFRHSTDIDECLRLSFCSASRRQSPLLSFCKINSFAAP